MNKLFLIIVLSLFLANANAASVDTINVPSASMRKTVRCVVIKPKSYFGLSDFLPVLFLLHGYSGNYAQWLEVAPQLKQVADDYPMLIICPDGGFDSWYLDSPVDTNFRYETFIAKELVLYIDQHYKTMAGANKRAIAGLSMGGHGALFLAAKHPDVFGAAGSMAGGVDFRPFPNEWGIKNRLGEFKDNADSWEEHTVMHAVNSLRNNQIRIIVDCGMDDFFLPVNRQLHEKLQSLKIDHDYIERPGAHNYAYCKNALDFQLLFFKKFFEKDKKDK